MDTIKSNEWENERPAEIKARHFVDIINGQIAAKVREEFDQVVRVSADLRDVDSRDMFLEGGSLDPDMARLGDAYDRITASENIVADITIRYYKGADAIRDYILDLCSTAALINKGAKTNYGALMPKPNLTFLGHAKKILSGFDIYMEFFEFDDEEISLTEQRRAEALLKQKLSDPYPYK